jgi:uncharacterized protein YdeI (YjbR/CyaY-like superfamily)
MKDLDFIAGTFFDCEIPKDKKYLLYYFRSDLQIAYLRYVIVFDEDSMFRQHTGYYCSSAVLRQMRANYRKLLQAHAEAKSDFSEAGMKRLYEIETGGYCVDRKSKSVHTVSRTTGE